MATQKNLTDRQEQVIDFICSEITDHSRSPSQAEVAHDLSIKRQTAAGHILALERKGWLSRGKGHRSLVPTGKAWRRQLLLGRARDARANLPRGLLSGSNARAAVAVASALRGIGAEDQQLILDLAGSGRGCAPQPGAHPPPCSSKSTRVDSSPPSYGRSP